MSLIENFFEKCAIMEKHKTADGEGGSVVEWVETETINAAIVHNSTIQALIAERQGVTSVYTITTSKDTILNFHDVIKRKKDGKVFRVTSNGGDILSPSVSSLNISQVTAEKWELTQ